MRTTLNLQDDAFQAASQYAAARAMKLGDAISELIRQGVGQARESKISMKKVQGIWIFDVPADGIRPKATAALVTSLMSA